MLRRSWRTAAVLTWGRHGSRVRDGVTLDNRGVCVPSPRPTIRRKRRVAAGRSALAPLPPCRLHRRGRVGTAGAVAPWSESRAHPPFTRPCRRAGARRARTSQCSGGPIRPRRPAAEREAVAGRVAVSVLTEHPVGGRHGPVPVDGDRQVHAQAGGVGGQPVGAVPRHASPLPGGRDACGEDEDRDRRDGCEESHPQTVCDVRPGRRRATLRGGVLLRDRVSVMAAPGRR